MKNILKILSVMFAIGFATVSCSRNDDEPVMSQTIYAMASRDGDLSSLKAAIDKAGLAATLDATGTFTVFAPSNAAFATFLTANGFASLNDVPVAALKEILLKYLSVL